MKKLLILTTFLSSLLMSSVAYAEWAKVSKSDTGDSYYVDFERIKKHDAKIYYWSLINNLKPNKYGEISFTSYVEAECERFRFRDLNQKRFKGPMGSGTIISSTNTPNENWAYPPPNSVAEAELKAVCNYKSMQ